MDEDIFFDDTAAFQDISDNYVVESFYRDILGAHATYRNRASDPHWIRPAPNLKKGDVALTIPLDSELNFKVCRPIPFLPPSTVHPADLRNSDPVESIVLLKTAWEQRLKNLLEYARKSKKWAEPRGLWVSKVKKKDVAKPIYTVSSIVDVAQHLANDPHPDFEGDYNWLMTGGSLCTCNIDGKKYILSSTGKNVDSLRVTAVEQQAQRVTADDTREVICVQLPNKSPIYQTVANRAGDKGIVCIRQEKLCSVVRLKQGSPKPFSARTLLEIQESDGVFTSIDSDPFDSSHFCTLDSGPLLKLWDLNTSACLGSASVEKSGRSSRGFVKYSNTHNEILTLNPTSVFVKDPRMPLSQNCRVFNASLIVDDCEEASLILTSPRLPIVYVPTSHCLLSLDLRRGWLQRWTHLLKSPPMFGAVCHDSMKSQELVLLSSCIPNDAVAMANKCEKQLECDSFPMGLSSVGDSLLLARVRGKCLGQYVKKRFELSTSGLTVTEPEGSGGFTLLRSTSIGDVFSQQILPKSSSTCFSDNSLKEEVQGDVEAWESWDKAHDIMCSKNNPELLCSTIDNKIFDVVTAPLSKDKTRYWAVKSWNKTFEEPSVQKRARKERTYSELLLHLSSYKDVMAHVLLKAWDDDDVVETPAAHDYVSSWLGNIPSSSGGPVSEDGRSEAAYSKTASEYCVSLQDETFSTSADPDASIGHDSVFKLPSTPVGRPPKKKKRESIGF